MKIQRGFQKCSICQEPSSLTSEHLIPRSIGGTLQSDIQCKSCNDTLGATLVSQVKKDPSVRLAIRNLKAELLELFESMEHGLPYLVTDADEERPPAVRRKGNYRIRPHKRADGSIITETTEAAQNLKRMLSKDGLNSKDIASALERFTEAPVNTRVVLSDRTTVVKHSRESTIEPQLSGGLMSDRALALVAYNYLCLLMGEDAFRPELDSVRSYIQAGDTSEVTEVEHFTSRKYAPYHRLRVEPERSGTIVEVVLFGWLVYRVRFEALAYGPVLSPVYIEDLSGRQGLFADSWNDAKAGRFYI